jgi:hypothetical protein
MALSPTYGRFLMVTIELAGAARHRRQRSFQQP